MYPLVSIGLPVYNGQKFINAAIDSILAQTLTDFELIICDNCSNDRTEAICRNYAAQDSRVHYYRNEQNIGATNNFNRAFALATGKYFKWATHDDRIEPTYLERCVNVLENDPSVVLCHTQTQIVDEQGQPVNVSGVREFIQDSNGRPLRVGIDRPDRHLESAFVHERFEGIVLLSVWCYEIFGLIRTDALRKTSLHRSFYGSDKVLLAELIAFGKLTEIPERLFQNRRHPNQSGSLTTTRARELWIAPLAKHHNPFPRLLCLKGYLRVALRYPMPLKERLRCLAVIAHYLLQPSRWRNLIRELRGQPMRPDRPQPENNTIAHKLS